MRLAYISLYITLIILLTLGRNTCLSEDITSEPYLYYFVDGKLFSIDTRTHSIERLLAFDVTAPDIDRSPDGLFWGRTSFEGFGALDPKSGNQVAKVVLPSRAYYQTITPSGKAYITHNVLTHRGFSISVVDTVDKTYIKKIDGIMGLHTSFAQYGDSVYHAALGVRRPDYLYLYEIDTRTDMNRELYRVIKTDYRLELSIYRGQLYISYICGKNRDAPPLIESMDLETKKIRLRIGPDQLGDIEKIVEGVTFYQGIGVLPCMVKEGRYGIAFFDPQRGKVFDVIAIPGSIEHIVGIKENILVYSNKTSDKGKTAISLHFFSMKERKEVKAINISKFLEE